MVWILGSLFYSCSQTCPCYRMEKIEPLDEFEEWNLFNEHYCMSWALKDASAGAGESKFADVGFKPAV